MAWAIAFSSSCSVIRVCASTAANGSSISMTSGFAASVRATATRCRMPPDSSCGYFCSKPGEPDQLDEAPHGRGALGRGTPWISSPWAMFRSHGAPGQDGELLKDDAAIAGRARSTGRPSSRTSPRGGRDEAGQDAEQRGLAAAARPDQREELAFGDVEVDAVERDHALARERVDVLVAEAPKGDLGGHGRRNGLSRGRRHGAGLRSAKNCGWLFTTFSMNRSSMPCCHGKRARAASSARGGSSRSRPTPPPCAR